MKTLETCKITGTLYRHKTSPVENRSSSRSELTQEVMWLAERASGERLKHVTYLLVSQLRAVSDVRRSMAACGVGVLCGAIQHRCDCRALTALSPDCGSCRGGLGCLVGWPGHGMWRSTLAVGTTVLLSFVGGN